MFDIVILLVLSIFLLLSFLKLHKIVKHIENSKRDKHRNNPEMHAKFLYSLKIDTLQDIVDNYNEEAYWAVNAYPILDLKKRESSKKENEND